MKKCADKLDSADPAQRTGEVFDDTINTDQLFEGDDEDEAIMLDGDTGDSDAEEAIVLYDDIQESAVEDSMDEDDEEEMFDPKPKQTCHTTSPSTTRQLVMLVCKKMNELYELFVVKPGNPGIIPGYEFACSLRRAVDKVKYEEVGDLVPGKRILN